MATKIELAEEQIRLQEEVQKSANINIVNCGNCGTVLLHDRNKTEIQCACCKHLMDVSDCPDLWYENCQNNSEFQEDEPTITVDDVVKVAMDLNLNPSVTEINEVLKYYPTECKEDPTANWTFIVENLLYNCITPKA